MATSPISRRARGPCTAPFGDWDAALRFLVRLAETDPLLVVIDEAPRLLSSQHDFADLVSAVWENRRLLLVLTRVRRQRHGADARHAGRPAPSLAAKRPTSQGAAHLKISAVGDDA